MSEKYDRQGVPIGLLTWCTLMEDAAYRIVARTDLGDGAFVSTIWLGLNHRHGEGAPLIFETMVFGMDGSTVVDRWADRICERYSTEAEALAGHERIVRGARVMSARCERCRMPLTAVARLIADVTALLDMSVPLPAYLSRPWLEDDGTERRNHLERCARMGAAQAVATEALAVAHGFCSARCAHEQARSQEERHDRRPRAGSGL
jgi:hypothetical protein